MSEYQASNGWAVDGPISSTVQATEAGQAPVLESDGKLPGTIIPDVSVQFTIPVDAWQGTGPYTATITVAGAAEIATPIIGADSPDDSEREALAGAQITALSVSSTGAIALVADGDKPTLPIRCVATGTKGTQTGMLLSAFGAGGGGSMSFFLNVHMNASAGSPDLSGISVTATPTTGTAVSGTTDSTGLCTLSVKQGLTYAVVFVKTDFTFSPSSATVTVQDTSTDLNVSCYEAPKLAVICEGDDKASRTITATPEDGEVITGTTGSDGKVTLKLEIADYTVVSDYPEGQGVSPASATVSAAAGGSYTKTFTILGKPTIAITATDHSSAGYEQGRTITATPTSGGTTVTGQTGSDGKVTLTLMAGTAYTIGTDVPSGYVKPSNYPLTPQAGQAYTYDFDLYEEAQVTVTVGPDAIKSGRTLTATASGMAPVTGTTSSDGTCTLSLPEGDWTISADTPTGYYATSAKTLSVTAGQTYSLTFGYDAKPVLTATVTPAAVAGSLLVKAIGDTTVTGYTSSSGIATLTLDEDEYTLSVEAPSGYLTPDTQTLTAVRNQTYSKTFALLSKPLIQATVTDSSGAGLEVGRLVTATSADGSDVVTGTTVAGGTVSLMVNTVGSYTISSDTPEGATCDPVTVTVAGGGSYTAALVLSFGWTHAVSFNATTIQTDPTGCLTYADDSAGFSPVYNTSASLAKVTDEGSWGFDTDTGMDIEGLFYATFQTGTSGQYFHQLLNPYNLAQVLATWDDDAKEWDYSQTGSSAITTENTMLCIPTFYRKGTDTKLLHSSKSSEGTAYMHTIGSHVYDYKAVGVYLAYNSSSTLKSLSGVTPTRSQTRAMFRTQAQANTVRNGVANQWSFHDWRGLVEKSYIRAKTFNLQDRTGKGGMSYSSPSNGSCNALGPYAGDISGMTNAQKLLIENFWGCCYQWVDDCYASGTQIYAGQNASPTDDMSNKTAVPQAAIGGFPLTVQTCDLGWGMGLTSGGSSTTGMCDYVTSNTSNPVPYVGGSSDNVSNGVAGPGFLYRFSLSSSDTSIGARLAFAFDVE